MTTDLASRLEIEDLAARYNLAVDFGDPAGWVSCFRPDGEFEIVAVGPRTAAVRSLVPGCWRGEAELTEFATTVAGSLPCRHWSHNRLLTPASDGLESVSYMNVYYLDAPPESRLITGVMRDRLARTGEGWRFASRRITFD
jgi:SnoaL-like domain